MATAVRGTEPTGWFHLPRRSTWPLVMPMSRTRWWVTVRWTSSTSSAWVDRRDEVLRSQRRLVPGADMEPSRPGAPRRRLAGSAWAGYCDLVGGPVVVLDNPPD